MMVDGNGAHLVFLSVEPNSGSMGKDYVMAYYVRFCG